MSKEIKIATVFSGIGAVEFALKRLEIKNKIVFSCDNGGREIEINYEKEFKKVKSLKSIKEKKEYIDNIYGSNTRKANYVQQSYEANYSKNNDTFFQDIRLIDGNDFKNKVDLFVGGSPCQSFSSVGFQKGLEDTRGTLFYEFARLVKEIQPKVFIYENVRGLLNHDKGQTWEVIQKVFDSLGYKYYHKILNSKDYGIPQNRNRLFVIGFKDKNVNFEFPKEIKLKYKMQDFLIEELSEGNFNRNSKGSLILSKKPGKIDEKYFLSPKIYDYVMKSGTKTFKQKPVIDLEIARPLLSTMGNRHRAGVDNYVTVNKKVRMLSEREAHRLMGFTDDYKIIVSRAQAYKQAGNSIVVDVLMSIIKEIQKTKVI